MLYWSVSISGSTTRIYHSHITGSFFTNFETPAVMYNPGFDIIDADIIKVANNNYQMFFKDERSGYKYIRRAYGATVPSTGYTTYTNVVANAATEGPTVFRAGGVYNIIVDHYSNAGLGIVRSRNIDTALSPWPGDASRMVYNGTGTTLMLVSHCNVIEVPKLLVKWMLYNDSAWVRYVNGTEVRNPYFVPVHAPNSSLFGADMKIFDIAGRVQRILNGSDASSGPFIGHLPPGYYIKSSGDKKSGAIKGETQSR
jgi:hypothetical protein